MAVSALSDAGQTYAGQGVEAARDTPRGAHLRVVGEAERVRRPRVRITRRGRLVRTLVVFGVLCVLALTAWARLSAASLPPTHAVTVQSGQGLSDIARTHLPGVPLDLAVTRIQIANGLPHEVVAPGAVLVIPGS